MNEWFLALTVAVLLFDRVISFYKSHMKEKPDPAQTYATRVELAEIKSARKEDEDRAIFYRREIYDKIETTNDKIETLRKDIGEDMDELASQIKNAPAETVALLRNTKGLLL